VCGKLSADDAQRSVCDGLLKAPDAGKKSA
jgi:hypothetical protein